LIEALESTLALTPQNDSQKTAQREIVGMLELIAAYGTPFSGDVSVGPDLLEQVVATEPEVKIAR
jgi:hypothetical protein